MNDHHEHDGPDAVITELLAERPVPPAGFRGALRRRLVALGPPSSRPPHLWRLAAVYAVVGLILLLIGVASVAGIGPLAS